MRNQLAETKMTMDSGTLLHYIARHLDQQDPGLIDFLSAMPHVDAAGRSMCTTVVRTTRRRRRRGGWSLACKKVPHTCAKLIGLDPPATTYTLS